MGTQGVKWIPISPPAAVNSSRLTDDGNRRASIRNPMLAGPRGSRMSEIQYHHDVDDAVPEVTIQNALLEDEAALPLGEVDVTYGNSDNEVVPTIEEASAEYMKLREYLAGNFFNCLRLIDLSVDVWSKFIYRNFRHRGRFTRARKPMQLPRRIVPK